MDWELKETTLGLQVPADASCCLRVEAEKKNKERGEAADWRSNGQDLLLRRFLQALGDLVAV